MTCPICGKHTLPGARLCGPCRSALKRARDDSVWELPPGLKRPTGTPSAEPVAAPQWVLGSKASLGWRTWAVVLVVAGAAIAALVKLAFDHDSAAAATPAVRSTLASGPLASDVTPASARMAAPIAAKAEAAAVLRSPEPPSRAQVVHLPRDREHPAVPARVAKAPSPATEPAPPAVPAPAPVAQEPVRVAAAPPASPARPADPWQPLNDAIARCGSEGLFARIGCEHRARMRWCDGHWGEVAQCPAGLPADHGQ